MLRCVLSFSLSLSLCSCACLDADEREFMSRLWTPKLSRLPLVTLRIVGRPEQASGTHSLHVALLSSPRVLSVSTMQADL